ncbi:MAG: thymidylate synthase [Minisyncoccia bacterium]
MDPKYLPYENRQPNTQYKNRLSSILKCIKRQDIFTKNPFQTQGRYSVKTLSPMVLKLSNGFPIGTERNMKMFWVTPIGELLAFIHGVRDARVLSEEWGVKWWLKQWATPEKCADFGLEHPDMGPGSYGGAFEYVAPDGTTYNQFKEVLKQMRDRPDVTTHKITSWLPHYTIGHNGRQRKVIVAPCHGDIEMYIVNGRLTLRMDQRSADFPIGVPSNTIQYAALTIMIAHVLGLEPDMLIHSTHDSHFYEDQLENVRELVKCPTYRYPSVYLTEEGQKVTDLFDFRPSHFRLEDYHPGPAMNKIPVTT